jgi:hypothetical protein
MFKALMMAAMFHLIGGQAMAQPTCDVVKIAEDYAKARWPVDLATDRHGRHWPDGAVIKVAFELPPDSLGDVPEIGIDPQSCRVVSAKLWQ